MYITILGAGPAGLYCGLLLKKANPSHHVRILERNPPDATYGWGVVFSDRTLAAFQEADFKSYKAITSRFVLWDAIDTYYRGELIHCSGHVFAGLARKVLLTTLQERCRELGVLLAFSTEVERLESLAPADLVIAADGVNSLARRTHEAAFVPRISPGTARYIWLGADKTLDAFTFIFKESEYGLFQVHSYPFSGDRSTFIVECAEDVWRRAGLEQASEQESIVFCERLFADELRGARLYSNNSKWINFSTLKCAHWHTGNLVLLGDAAHTAHFSIGSGTKLAMEDAIALANAIEQYPDLERALTEYELTRRPIVELLQGAAAESQGYFEHTQRFTTLPSAQFSFNLLTRSKRITYDDLRLRDPRYIEWVDRSFATCGSQTEQITFAPPPVFTSLALGGLSLSNRIVTQPSAERTWTAQAGAGLEIYGPLAVSADGRATPNQPGLYDADHSATLRAQVDSLHETSIKVCAVLNHAGRRGASRAPTASASLLDRPLVTGAWPLVSASALPYTPRSQTPSELTRDAMRAVIEQFTSAASVADARGFDMLLLHMAQGYLLASFLSPLTNQRTDDFGGSLANRMRFPLEVFAAVREVWPRQKPLGVALNCHDGVKGGLTLDDAVATAASLKALGCDLIQPMAGQTTPEASLPYGKAFLAPLAERIRTEVGMVTLVGGYITTTNEANTLLAGGRADLILMTPPSSRHATPQVKG
ncbi:MAG TPA: FAD-dependent monooxygenase [Ktedonobacterales bacterium]